MSYPTAFKWNNNCAFKLVGEVFVSAWDWENTHAHTHVRGGNEYAKTIIYNWRG